MIEHETRSRGRPKNLSKTNKKQEGSPYTKPRSISHSKSAVFKTTSLGSTSKTLFQEAFAISDYKNSNNFSEDLYINLMKKVKASKNNEEEFEACQKCFVDLIKSSKKHGKTLKIIKSVYDAQLSVSDFGSVSKLRGENKDLQNQISQFNKDKQLFLKKIEKFSKENLELSRTLDEVEGKYQKAVSKLQEIIKFDLKKVPKDEISWKALASENQFLSRQNKELQKKLKESAEQEKNMLSLLNDIKKKGLLLDRPPQSYKESDFDAESEALISGRAKFVQKPICVPALKLSNIEDSYFSDY